MHATQHCLCTIPLRLRSLFRWAQADRELDDGLRDHLERELRNTWREGWHPRKRGSTWAGIEQAKEKCLAHDRLNASGFHARQIDWR